MQRDVLQARAHTDPPAPDINFALSDPPRGIPYDLFRRKFLGYGRRTDQKVCEYETVNATVKHY